MRVLTIVLAATIAGCGGGSNADTTLDEAAGGACFARCGEGLSACYSGDDMTAAECRSIIEGMCPSGSADFRAGCECSDEPMQTAADCP